MAHDADVGLLPIAMGDSLDELAKHLGCGTVASTVGEVDW